jgi:hypothetical protein
MAATCAACNPRAPGGFRNSRGWRQAGGNLEVAPAGGLGAVDAVAPFDDVEIDLKDAALAPEGLDHHGDDGLLDLAQGIAGRRQEQVLGQLLADGRTAGDDAAFLQVLLEGVFDTFPVEAFVFQEAAVLGGDDGAFQVNGDARCNPPSGAAIPRPAFSPASAPARLP